MMKTIAALLVLLASPAFAQSIVLSPNGEGTAISQSGATGTASIASGVTTFTFSASGGGSSLACLPVAAYPDGTNNANLDSSAMHSQVVSLLTTAEAALVASGCPAIPAMPHGMNDTNFVADGNTLATWNSAHQWMERFGPWYEGAQNCDGSVNAGDSSIVAFDAMTANVANSVFGGHAFIDMMWSTRGGSGGNNCGQSFANGPTAYYTAFGIWMANVVKRYPNQVYWELFNEVDDCAPNTCTDFFGAYAGYSFYQQGEQYSAMLKIVVPLMRAAATIPIKIVIAGLGMNDATPTGFLQGVYDSGGFAPGLLDVMNEHVYGGVTNRMLNESVYYRTWMNNHGLDNMQLWATEYGDQSGNLGNGQVDAPDQAAYQDLQTWGIVQADSIYDWDCGSCQYALAGTATETWFTQHPGTALVPNAPVTVGALTFDDEFATIANDLSDSTTHDATRKWYTQSVYCCTAGPPSLLAGSGSSFSQISGGGLQIAVPSVGGIIGTYSPDTMNGWSQQYGYFELKAQMPALPGAWPGWWMVNYAGNCTLAWNCQTNSPGVLPGATGVFEIDIFEGYMGPEPANCLQWTNNNWTTGQVSNPTGEFCANGGVDLTAGWHIYGFLWDPINLTWFIDGVQVAQTATNAVEHSPALMILDNGPDTPYHYTQSTMAQPSNLKIAYVRAWALN